MEPELESAYDGRKTCIPCMSLLLDRITPVNDRSCKMSTHEIHNKLIGLIKLKIGWDESWTEAEMPSEFKLASHDTLCKELKKIYWRLGWEEDTASPNGYFIKYDDQTKATRAKMAEEPVIKMKPTRKSPRGHPYTPPPETKRYLTLPSDSPFYELRRSSLG